MQKKFYIFYLLSNLATLCAIDLEPYRELQLNAQEITKALEFIASEEKDCAWIPEYPIVGNLINSMGLKIGCELGVAYGGQSNYLLENTNLEKLYSVDPYQHFSDYEYKDGGNFKQNVFDVLFIKVKNKLSLFGDRSILLRKTSAEAAGQFVDFSLDFVYIDANHAYEYVKQDLELWFNKVRSGGLLIGDDYIVWPGVSRAVKEFAKNHNITFHIQGNKWWFVKP